MDSGTSELTKTAIAVPGALGIILAIATFVFMAWLVRFVLKTNEKREDRLAKIIESDLEGQKAQLDRLEEGHRFQRAEHEKIMVNQDKCLERHDASVLVLERIAGMLLVVHPSSIKKAI